MIGEPMNIAKSISASFLSPALGGRDWDAPPPQNPAEYLALHPAIHLFLGVITICLIVLLGVAIFLIAYVRVGRKNRGQVAIHRSNLESGAVPPEGVHLGKLESSPARLGGQPPEAGDAARHPRPHDFGA
jgi:hypothetical protein